MDEAGFEHSIRRLFAKAKRGTKIDGYVSGKIRRRVSMIGAYCQKKLIAPMTFDGFCDQAVVLTWMKHFLLPVMKPGQVLILDNASFHNPKQIRNLLKTINCRVLFLPPYSPDLNPIEHLWAQLNSILRKCHSQDADLYSSIDNAIKVLFNI